MHALRTDPRSTAWNFSKYSFLYIDWPRARCNSFHESKPSSAKGTLTLTSLHSMSSGYRPMFSTLADQINCQIPTLTSQKSIAHLANPIAKTVMGPTVYVAPHSLSLWLNTTC